MCRRDEKFGRKVSNFYLYNKNQYEKLRVNHVKIIDCVFFILPLRKEKICYTLP